MAALWKGLSFGQTDAQRPELTLFKLQKQSEMGTMYYLTIANWCENIQ